MLTALLACSYPGPTPKPTRSPRPTITATLAITARGTRPAPATPSLAATPPALTQTALHAARLTAIGLPPPGRTPAPATRSPLDITGVMLVSVERDPRRDNGAIASVQVVFAGGREPYAIYHDDVKQQDNPFPVPTVCSGSLVHTVRIVSGDGQTATTQYFLAPILCPP